MRSGFSDWENWIIFREEKRLAATLLSSWNEERERERWEKTFVFCINFLGYTWGFNLDSSEVAAQPKMRNAPHVPSNNDEILK